MNLDLAKGHNMLPILAGIVTQLISANLPKLAQAVVDKGVDYVEEKIGVKLEPNMPPEKIAEIQAKAQEHEEFMVEQDNKNTADARDMNSKVQESQNASWLAKNAAYIMDFMVILATIALSCFAYFIGVPDVNKELVYMALGSLITMTGTILNFHRGSSASSQMKNDIIFKKQ